MLAYHAMLHEVISSLFLLSHHAIATSDIDGRCGHLKRVSVSFSTFVIFSRRRFGVKYVFVKNKLQTDCVMEIV